ncbi:MAG: Ig-like domain-containing protein [Pirellulales bacterium]
MAQPSFFRRTVRKVLRGATWLKSVGRYNERFPQIFRADKWRPAGEGSVWMNLFGMRTSPLSLVGTRRRGRNNLQRLLRIEGLEQKQLLAVNVAVVDSGDNAPYQAIVDQLNDDTQGFDLNAVLVQPSQIASDPDLLLEFDVVVFGSDGVNADSFSTFSTALNDWAEGSGGGVVGVGFAAFGIRNGAVADLDAILPVAVIGSTETFENPGSVLVINPGHPVTTGVNSITVAASNFFESVQPPADAWGTVLGTYASTNLGVVAGTIPTGLNPGRSVYLGPNYAGASTNYDTTQLRTGDGDRLLEQAVNWAANVPPVDPPPTIVNSGSTAAEGGTDTITNTELLAVDPGEAATDLKYTVTTAPTNALGDTLRLSGVPTTTFTQADINAGLVTYVHDGSETTNDSFKFSLTDGTTTISNQNFAITVTPVNDPPVAADQSITTNQGQAKSGTLTASDAEGDTLTFAPGTAPTNGAVSINPTTGSFTYTPNAGFSGSDSFTFTVDDPGPGGPDSGLVNVTVTPVTAAKVSIAATDPAAEPNDDGFFTVTMSAASATPTSVTYNVSGSAKNGTDYQPLSGFLSIPAGATSAKIDVDVIDDTTQEGTENVFVALSTVSGSPGVVIDTTADDASLNIADNDPAPPPDSVSAGVIDGIAAEPADDGKFSVTLSAPSATDTKVTFSLTGSASAGADYQPLELFVVIPAGSTTVPVLIDVIDDTAVEGPESVVFTLIGTNNPGIIVNPAADDASLTIADNDSVVSSTITVAANDSAAAEVLSPGAPNPGSFRISISPNSGTATTVNYTVTGSAANGTDYAAIASSAVIPANTAFVDIPINVTDDTLVEGNETVTITLTSSSGTPGAAVNLTPATVNIADNDPTGAPPTVGGTRTSTVAEGGTDSITQAELQTTDPDTVPAGLTYTLTDAPDNGTLRREFPTGTFTTLATGGTFTQEDINLGRITYVHNGSETTSDSFAFSVTDGSSTRTGTFAITVTQTNNPPTVVNPLPDLFNVSNESAPRNISLAGVFSDPEGQPLTFTVTSTNPAVANASVSGSTLTLTFTPNQQGTATVTVTANDNSGGQAQDPFNVQVIDTVNQPVTAGDDVFTAQRNQTLNVTAPGVLSNDIDPDGDTLQAALLSTTTNGSLQFFSNGGFTYTPNQNFSGNDEFTYRAFDGRGSFDDAKVTINFQNQNPIAVDDKFTTTRATPVSGNVILNDSDPDNDFPLFVGLSRSPANGTVVLQSNGQFTYTPNSNIPVPPSKEATDFFEYVLSDPRGGTDVGRVDITVTAPTGLDAANDAFTAPEDTVISGNLLANDVDPEGDATFTLVSTTAPASGALLTSPNGAFTYTPFTNFFGTDTFTYTIRDTQGFTDTATVTLTLTPVNDIQATDDVFNINEGETLTRSAPGLMANDFDPDLNQEHKFPITGVIAAAGDNTAPFTGPTSKGGTVTVQSNGAFTYTPAAQFFGTDTFTYAISDTQGTVDTGTVTINVGGENDRPDAVNDSAAVLEDSANNFIDVLGNDTDPDGDKLFVEAVSPAANGTVQIISGFRNNDNPQAGGGVRYTPNPNFQGVDTFTYRVTDGRAGDSDDTATVTVIVSDTPDVPSPVDDTFDATEDQTITLTEAQILGNDFNPNATGIMIIAISDDKTGTVGGKATLNADRSITFDPNDNFTGAAGFNYFISGARTNPPDPGRVTINFAPVNDPPVVGTDNFNTGINTPITVTTTQLLSNDSDVEGGILQVVSVSNPLNGTVAFNTATGEITFTPNQGFTSSVGNPATFNYTVTDNQGGFTTGQVIINVQVPNRPPVAVDEIIRTVRERERDGDNRNVNTRIEFPRTELDDNDTDPDGDPVTFVELVAGSAIGGTVSLVGTNNVTVRFDTTVNFVGDASFEYKVTDGRGAFDIGKATIRVQDFNDPPDARNDSKDTPEDTKVTIDVLLNDLDADFANAPNANGKEFLEPNADGGDPGPTERLRVITVGTAANGMATLGVGGVVSYTPNQDFNGTDSFSYTIADLGQDNIAGTADDLTDSATVTIIVGDANDVIARDDGVPDRIKVNEFSIRNSINVLANDSDPEGQTFQLTSVTQGARGVVEIGPGGTVLYTPDPGFSGLDQFTYTITDSLGATDSATVFVEVTDVGDPPNAVDDSVTVIEDSGPNVINVRANDTDPDNPANPAPPASQSPPPSNVRVVAVTQGANGAVQIRQQPDQMGGFDVVYTPNANFSGTDFFTYTLRDPDGSQDTATVTVTVVARPDVPDAVNDVATVGGGTNNNPILVLANDVDPDGDPLTVVSVTQPTRGTASVAPDGKSVLYSPISGFAGNDVFQYTVRDPSGFTDTATVLVTVLPSGPNFFGTPGDDIFLVRLDPTATNIQVFNDATASRPPVFTAPRASAPQFTFTTGEGNDRVIVDLLNGDPLPSAGISYDGGVGNDMFEVRDIGTSTGVLTPSGTTAGTGTVTLGTGFINLANVEPIDITGLASFRYVTPNGNDTLTLTSPAVNTAQLAGASGALALSAVTFRDVGNFIIDAAANDAGAGNDSLTVTPGVGRTLPNNVGFMEYRSGTGANTLNLTNGSARLNSTVAAGGTLDTTVGANAELITTRFRQNSLALGNGARATVLSAGTPDAVSRLNSLSMDTGSKLDLNDNSLVIDFTDTNPVNIQNALNAIRNLIVQGRGGAGIGNGVWNGNGITSSAARAANLLNPESRSIGFAHNGSLPLGQYTNWRGQPVDGSTFLIGFTRTGDATLDSVVNDNDATILGAVYPLATGGTWATGDFDYNQAVNDDDATLLGAFFDPNATAFPAPAPAPAPLAAAGEAFFAEVGSGGSGSSSAGGVNISAADLAALADEIFAEEESTGIRKTKFGV